MKKEIKIKKEIVGEKIDLKILEPTIELAQEIFELIQKNKKHLEPWMPWAEKTKTVIDVIEFLLTSKDLNYGLFNKKGKYMGGISIMKLDVEKNKSAEFGYWIGKEFTRNGYMSEAVALLEKELFENLDLNRLVIGCNIKNIASKKVAEKNNYFFEGVSREDRFNDFTGKLEDSLNFSKLKEEYLKLKSKK